MDFGLNVIPHMAAGEWLVLRSTPHLPSCSHQELSAAPWTPQIFNTTTGARLELPGYRYQSLSWNPQESALFGFQTTSTGTSSRWMRVDLGTMSQTEQCREHEGEWLDNKSPKSIGSLRDGTAITLSYSAGRVFVYGATADGRCLRKNGFPAAQAPSYFDISLAPDENALVVSMALNPGMPSQLIYVPLNSAPPIQITSPRYPDTFFNFVDFIGSNANEILMTVHEPQRDSGSYYHIWRRPTEP